MNVLVVHAHEEPKSFNGGVPTPSKDRLMLPSAIEAIIERAIYATDLNAAEQFYTNVLGLRVSGREPGRHVFFAVGAAQVLLVFDPARTRRPGEVAPHGAEGPGHYALGVRADTFGAWRSQLGGAGVSIESEIARPRGGQSLYFRDPAGVLGREYHGRRMGNAVWMVIAKANHR